MKIPSVNVDDQGHSYFGEVMADDKNGRERQFDISYWQVWETKPGHYADFKPTPEPKCLAMMSGKLEVTVSSGETRYFTRGDTFLLQDTSGRGHAVRTIGTEPCSVLLLTMPEPIAQTAE